MLPHDHTERHSGTTVKLVTPKPMRAAPGDCRGTALLTHSMNDILQVHICFCFAREGKVRGSQERHGISVIRSVVRVKLNRRWRRGSRHRMARETRTRSSGGTLTEWRLYERTKRGQAT